VTVLVGDIGGTNSRLALYEGREPRFERVYPSADHGSLDDVAALFLEEARRALGPGAEPARACLAVAGPVVEDTCKTTNLPWFVDARRLERRLGVTLLGPEHLVPLGGGERQETGPMVVVGPGTGLGQAFLVWSAAEGGYQVIPSEGGHADFTPRSGLETALLHHLVARHGRVSFERVLSGPGLAEIFSFLADEASLQPLVTEETRAAMATEDPAAVVSRQALAEADPVCQIALHLFSSVLGGLAGNLALTFLATGGVFIAGGIPPKILPVLQGGTFREAFESKGRFAPLAARIPAYVVTHRDLGLLGAAEFAARLRV
jgi:glucokinase